METHLALYPLTLPFIRSLQSLYLNASFMRDTKLGFFIHPACCLEQWSWKSASFLPHSPLESPRAASCVVCIRHSAWHSECSSTSGKWHSRKEEEELVSFACKLVRVGGTKKMRECTLSSSLMLFTHTQTYSCVFLRCPGRVFLAWHSMRAETVSISLGTTHLLHSIASGM